MTEPERLLVSGSGFEQALLGAGAVEKPSAALVARMEQGLGLGGATTATATAALSGKLIAAIAATATVGGIAIWSLSGEPPYDTSTKAGPAGIAAQDVAAQDIAAQDEVRQGPARDDVAPREFAPREVAGGSTAEQESILKQGSDSTGEVASEPRDHSDERASRTRVGSSRSAAKVPSSTVSGPTSTRLKEEVRLLDRVRAALEAGQKAQAFSLLDQYQSRFPEGVLRPEARKLRQNANAL